MLFSHEVYKFLLKNAKMIIITPITKHKQSIFATLYLINDEGGFVIELNPLSEKVSCNCVTGDFFKEWYEITPQTQIRKFEEHTA